MTDADAPPLDWQNLGSVSPGLLLDTRLELHWAVQLIGTVPLAVLEATPDFSHANLGWIANQATFVTRQIGSSPSVRLGLALREFALTILDAEDRVMDDLSLGGTTLEEGYGWIVEMMDRHGISDLDPDQLPRPDDTFPDHAVSGGAAFTGGDPAARAELARWYDNALLVFSEIVRDTEAASPVRTWPHHFDIATVITLEAAPDPEKTRSMGIGMSPGDSSYGEPYLYVTPWPYPDDSEVPSMNGNGAWHTEGWIGAVLTGSRLMEGAADRLTQLERTRSFLRSATVAVRTLAGG